MALGVELFPEGDFEGSTTRMTFPYSEKRTVAALGWGSGGYALNILVTGEGPPVLAWDFGPLPPPARWYNGILYQISADCSWATSGGQLYWGGSLLDSSWNGEAVQGSPPSPAARIEIYASLVTGYRMYDNISIKEVLADSGQLVNGGLVNNGLVN
ncbi:MAG: hypothetical protein FVQ80_01320 [Planctomycetes bacterium]|nr:hypothetical protein [Planctomycetota bacterium]